MKKLLIDVNNLVYKTLHISAKDCDSDFHYWKHVFLTYVFFTIKKFKVDSVYFCQDDKKNWRKSIFNGYKSHRKESRKKDNIDYKKFWEVAEDFLNQMKNTFGNLYFIRVENCEADDVIATICKQFNFDDVTIVSNDSDFKQLLVNKNVSIYDHQKRKMVTCINPQADLEIKIIKGDRSDSIKPIFKGCGDKTAIKVFNDLHTYLEDEQIKENYIMNRKLIDLNEIPEIYQKKIINEIENYKIKKFNSLKVITFLANNKLPKLLQMLIKNNFISNLS